MRGTPDARRDAADLSLGHVALAIGYSDQSRFTRRFKRHVGCTRGIYDREHTRARLPSEH
jgi:AraC family transcriptional regulator